MSRSLRTDLALDALEMGLRTRRREDRDVTGPTHTSDKEVQCVAVRYVQRAEAGSVASVGSTGDNYDNAPAKSFNSLFNAELVGNRGPWRTADERETTTAEYIDWFSRRAPMRQFIGAIPHLQEILPLFDDFAARETLDDCSVYLDLVGSPTVAAQSGGAMHSFLGQVSRTGRATNSPLGWRTPLWRARDGLRTHVRCRFTW